MFDLEKAIATWRKFFAHRRGLQKADLDELERHLRDDVAQAVRQGVPVERAFREAVAGIGDYEGAEEEYRKVYWGKLKRQHRLVHELNARLVMFSHYLKTILRSLSRKKGYAFINIAGLTLGMACCLVIFQFVAFEYSFDRFHAHEPDLYRVNTLGTRIGEEEGTGGGAYTPHALGPALEAEVPEVLHVARLHPEYASAIVSSQARPDRVFEETRVLYTDPAFLEMFTFPLVKGGAASALAEPGTALISETTAQKYFGNADPIGQMLDVAGRINGSYRVDGVFRDVPANSHLQFDFLLPIDGLVTEAYTDPAGAWNQNNFYTYVQLRPGADPVAAERNMTETLKTHRGEEYREMGLAERALLQPLRDVHLNDEIEAPELFITSSDETVSFFMLIGLVTLLIALVNYVNLATARALDRAREVGVRKVVGAQRGQLVTQFLCEAALTSLVAAVLAVVLAALAMPLVNEVAGMQLSGELWLDPGFWLAFLATLAVATLLAGLYPAFVLSSFRPAAVLKGKTGSFSGQLWLRRGLVVLQFAASVVLIGGTAVVYNQLGYMRDLELGLDMEQVVAVRSPRLLPEGTGAASAMATFKQELERLPSVRQVARSTTLPGQGFNWNGASVRRSEADPDDVIRGVATYIDTSFATLYGLELLAGRAFADLTPSGAENPRWPLMANESATKALGFETPEEAVGWPLYFGGYEAEIVGVYRDFRWASAHVEQQNIFFGQTNTGRHVSLRVTTEDLPGTLSAIETLYHRLFPGNVFYYEFVDEAFNRQYVNDQRFATLFTFFAGLAIAIACLGLFGLASFTTQRRTKEIGVRKVLGASVPGLVALLSRDFLKLVVVAVLIGSPVAYILMQRWLEGFAYRVEIGVGLFALVGVLSLVIALLSVAYESLRAALADPVRSLRVE